MLCIPQVQTPTQEVRADAAVNSGNTLAAWAEMMPAAEAIQMLDSAQQAYQAALAQEQDAAVSHLLYQAAPTPFRCYCSVTDTQLENSQAMSQIND